MTHGIVVTHTENGTTVALVQQRYRNIRNGARARFLRIDERGRIVLRCEQGMVWVDRSQFENEWRECK